jgi:hypothetical protein
MSKIFCTFLCFMLVVSLTSCNKPAPTLEETKSQEELILQEELKLQEETELAQRMNEQYPFSFEASAVKTYRYEDNHRLYGLDGDWVYYSSSKSNDDRIGFVGPAWMEVIKHGLLPWNTPEMLNGFQYMVNGSFSSNLQHQKANGVEYIA